MNDIEEIIRQITVRMPNSYEECKTVYLKFGDVEKTEKVLNLYNRLPCFQGKPELYDFLKIC